MSRLWNKKNKSLIPYVAGEQPRNGLRIKLNTNENPYIPSDAVRRVLSETDPASLRLYPDPQSLLLRTALSDYYGLPVGQIFVGNGSDEVLALAFQAFFETSPDALPVLFPDITYSFYPVYTQMYDIPWETVPLDDDFQVPADKLLAPSGGVVLANPNAPTGRTLPLADVERIVASDPDRVVIVDEAYVDFGGESCRSLVDRYDNILVVMTLSKSRALAGIRLGFALGSPALIEGLERVRDSFNSYPVNRLTEAIGAAAIRDGAWFESTRSKIMETRERTADALREMGFTVIPSAANFLFAGLPGVPGRDLYTTLREQGILVRYFDKPRIEGFVRITIGTPEQMNHCCEALKNTVSDRL